MLVFVLLTMITTLLATLLMLSRQQEIFEGSSQAKSATISVGQDLDLPSIQPALPLLLQYIKHVGLYSVGNVTPLSQEVLMS